VFFLQKPPQSLVKCQKYTYICTRIGIDTPAGVLIKREPGVNPGQARCCEARERSKKICDHWS